MPQHSRAVAGILEGVSVLRVNTGMTWQRGLPTQQLREPDLYAGAIDGGALSRSSSFNPVRSTAMCWRSIHILSSEMLAAEEGLLYPTLQKMLVKGWVTAEWGISETNRKVRFYRLTSEGRKHLKVELPWGKSSAAFAISSTAADLMPNWKVTWSFIARWPRGRDAATSATRSFYSFDLIARSSSDRALTFFDQSPRTLIDLNGSMSAFGCCRQSKPIRIQIGGHALILMSYFMSEVEYSTLNRYANLFLHPSLHYGFGVAKTQLRCQEMWTVAVSGSRMRADGNSGCTEASDRLSIR